MLLKDHHKKNTNATYPLDKGWEPVMEFLYNPQKKWDSCIWGAFHYYAKRCM